jgi:hypothetical protein
LISLELISPAAEPVNRQQMEEISNNIDILRTRVQILEDTVRVLLERNRKQINEEGYDAQGVLDQYMTRIQDLARMDKQQRDKARLK